MARSKTSVDGPLISKAQLDPIETAPALGKGQPLRVTTWPSEKSSNVYLVKTCPDGEVPDFVVGNSAVSAGSPGDIVYVSYPGSPVLLGGTVTKRDPLAVKSGKFIRAIKGDKYVTCAALDGVAGDLIPSATISDIIP